MVSPRAPSKAAQTAAIAVITATIQKLLTSDGSFTLEEEMVLDAIRRSRTSLNDASLDELKAYVGQLTPIQAQGFMNNVKGIYLEMLVVHAENLDGDDIFAEMFERTNHPGADVRLLQEGEVVGEFQVKATDNAAYIRHHFARYADTPVVATSDVAEMEGVTDSGFTNAQIENSVQDVLDELCNDATSPAAEAIGDVAAGATGSVLISAALQTHSMLRGGGGRPELKKTLEEAAVVGGFTAMIGMLLG